MLRAKAPTHFTCASGQIDISYCRVMGIINVAPDSFCERSRCLSIDAALSMAQVMIDDGAAILDIGGESTQPALGSLSLTAAEECERVVPVVTAIKRQFDIPVSVDTSQPEVIRASIAAGADMINDVRALRVEGALEAVASLDVPVCLMHMAYMDGKDKAQALDWAGNDWLTTVINFLIKRRKACIDAGIKAENIMLDPGFGAGNFGKSTQQNLQMIKRMKEFASLGSPLLVGVSRKSAIGDVLNQPVAQRLAGSLALAVLAAEYGANVIRTHDVKATVDALSMAQAVWEQD